MFIQVEPADFFMYTVRLIFDLEHENTEDPLVRDYLSEHELEPKYQWTAELEDSQCEFMQFGGCYLGRHLDKIGQIQRQSVEQELLTGEVDYRTPMSESEQYYQALKIRGIDSMLVRIPGASHSITRRPSNLLRKAAYILGWFDRYREGEG